MRLQTGSFKINNASESGTKTRRSKSTKVVSEPKRLKEYQASHFSLHQSKASSTSETSFWGGAATNQSGNSPNAHRDGNSPNAL